MARTRTLEVLRRLDPDGKREVVRFLHEHGLISEGQPIIHLSGADLSGANLADMDLRASHLSDVNLSGADMSRTQFCGFIGDDASWDEAIQRGGEFQDLMQPVNTSDFFRANLSAAVLRRTLLTGCSLLSVNFAGADLDGTDIRGGADLRWARNLTQEQIEQAYGSSGQQEYMPDTLLSEPLKAPEGWNRLLSQQRAEREATSN